MIHIHTRDTRKDSGIMLPYMKMSGGCIGICVPTLGTLLPRQSYWVKAKQLAFYDNMMRGKDPIANKYYFKKTNARRKETLLRCCRDYRIRVSDVNACRRKEVKVLPEHEEIKKIVGFLDDNVFEYQEHCQVSGGE